MRLLTLFFACYFACLSCLLCTDEVSGCREPAQTTVAAAHTDCGTDILGDWCSPLCQCQCCGGVVLSSAPAVAGAYLSPAAWASPARHGRLLVAAPTQVAATVWQPPQA